MKISVIIPAYNEAKTLPKIIKKILDLKIPFEKEIIVVDDGSTDESKSVENQIKDKRVKFLTNKKNMGKGASIIKALPYVRGDITIIQDADLEYDPSEFPKLLAPFKEKNVKVVYGSRVLSNNPVSHWTFNLGGRLVTLLTNLLYGTNITDEPTGYKVFKSDFLKKINLRSKRFEFCPEVTAKIAKLGVKITEVPISYKPRPVSEKKIKWHDGLAAIFYLLKYRFFD